MHLLILDDFGIVPLDQNIRLPSCKYPKTDMVKNPCSLLPRFPWPTEARGHIPVKFHGSDF